MENKKLGFAEIIVLVFWCSLLIIVPGAYILRDGAKIEVYIQGLAFLVNAFAFGALIIQNRFQAKQLRLQRRDLNLQRQQIQLAISESKKSNELFELQAKYQQKSFTYSIFSNIIDKIEIARSNVSFVSDDKSQTLYGEEAAIATSRMILSSVFLK